jgi:hypothetical protein
MEFEKQNKNRKNPQNATTNNVKKQWKLEKLFFFLLFQQDLFKNINEV